MAVTCDFRRLAFVRLGGKIASNSHSSCFEKTAERKICLVDYKTILCLSIGFCGGNKILSFFTRFCVAEGVVED